MTVYPQLKKLPGSVAKQSQLIWEEDSQATGQADPEASIKWNLHSWRSNAPPSFIKETLIMLLLCMQSWA